MLLRLGSGRLAGGLGQCLGGADLEGHSAHHTEVLGRTGQRRHDNARAASGSAGVRWGQRGQRGDGRLHQVRSWRKLVMRRALKLNSGDGTGGGGGGR